MEENLKELKELLEKLEGITSGGKSKEKRDNMKKAKQEVRQQLERDLDCMIFISENGSLATGSTKEIMAMISLLIHDIKENIPTELLTQAFVYGVADEGEGNEVKINRDEINNILEAMKEIV